MGSTTNQQSFGARNEVGPFQPSENHLFLAIKKGATLVTPFIYNDRLRRSTPCIERIEKVSLLDSATLGVGRYTPYMVVV